MKDDQTTSYSLLGRALDLSDEEAWTELYERYTSFIYYLLRRFNVNEHEMDDLAQQIMIKLMHKVKLYDRSQGKFRSWFSTLVRNEVLTHFRKLQGYNKKIEHFIEKGDSEEFYDELDAIVTKEWEEYIIKEALTRVEKSFKGQAIKVFKLWMDGKKVVEIGETLGLTVNTVYNLKGRVMKSLKLEISEMTQALEYDE